MNDSKHVAFFRRHPGGDATDDFWDSKLYLINTQTGEERLLFESDHPGYSNTMPTLSPDGSRVAFISNRTTGMTRLWVANIDGSEARAISEGPTEIDLQGDGRITPISQKVPRWSPDGQYVAHWEGVPNAYTSPVTHIPDPQRDQLICDTFHVWVVDVDSGERRNAGKGDDPIWSSDGRLTRQYPDPPRGGVVIMIQSAPESDVWQELPILPPKTLMSGRFSWAPMTFAAVV